MKHNNLTKELLQLAPHAFVTLHNVMRFDFEKDFKIVRLDGRFTINSAIKAIGTDNFAVLIKTNKRYINDLRFAEICGGRLDIDYSISGDVHECYTKKDFEECRAGAIQTYLIAQDEGNKVEFNKYHRTYTGNIMNYKHVKPIDFAERVQVIDRWYMIQNGYKYFVNWEIPKCTTAQFDKSGYRVDIKREELRELAKTVRTSRRQDEADRYDATNDIKQFYATLDELKTMFKLNAATVETAIDYLKFGEISRNISLQIERVKQFENLINTKSFHSVKAIKERCEFITDCFGYLKKDLLSIGGANND